MGADMSAERESGVGTSRIVLGHERSPGQRDLVNVTTCDTDGLVRLVAVERCADDPAVRQVVVVRFSPASAEQLAHHILAAATEARGETGA